MKPQNQFANIVERIAAEHNITVEEVRREMEFAIKAGLQNPDPKVREEWNKVPRKGRVPTPDEWIAYVVYQAKL